MSQLALDAVVEDRPATEPTFPTNGRFGKGFRPVFLNATNFLLSDVRGALGPYLNVFLVTQQHWSQSSVGAVTTIGGLLGLVGQVPIGIMIDATHKKRGLVVAAIAVLAIGATVIFAVPAFWPVFIANTMMAVVGDVFAPAIAAITLGLYTRQTLAKRTGRNAAFDHAGNVAIAIVAAAVGYYFTQRAVFLLVPVFASLAAAAILAIPADAIDHARPAAPIHGLGAETAPRSRKYRRPCSRRPAGWR